MSDEMMAALEHPDPDLSDIADLPKELPLEEAQACHLARAIMRVEASLERQEAAYRKDMQAWQHHLAALQSRRDALRALLRDWMLRKDIVRLSSPFVTASITKSRTKIVVDDEPKAIALCMAIGAASGFRTKLELVKKEFDALYNATPATFKDAAHEETGEPGLSIRAR